MAVRFHLDDGSDLGLTISQEQARELLVVLGLDETRTQGGVGPAHGPFDGRFKPEWVLNRLGAFRRSMVQGRIREFTSPNLPCDPLLRCALALEELALRCQRLNIPLTFSEDVQ